MLNDVHVLPHAQFREGETLVSMAELQSTDRSLIAGRKLRHENVTSPVID